MPRSPTASTSRRLSRLLTAAWARKRRYPSKHYSVGAVVREVLEAVLPPAVESIVAAHRADEK